MVDIISFVISISATAGMQDLTAAEVATEMAAWERYNEHIAIISYAVTGISALLGGGAIASLGVGLFHAFKQAQSMATSLAMFGAGKAIGKVKAAQAAKAVAAEKAEKEAASAAKESKMEAASAAKAERDDDKTTAHGMRIGGVDPATIMNMSKKDNLDIFKGYNYFGQKIDAATGKTQTLNPSNYNHMDNMDFVAVNAKSGYMDPQVFDSLANKVRDGGEFAIVGKNGITAKFERTGNDFFETTAGHGSKTNPGFTSYQLHKRFFSR
jgi:hypothetical protein